jgi:hypothetical protein
MFNKTRSKHHLPELIRRSLVVEVTDICDSMDFTAGRDTLQSSLLSLVCFAVFNANACLSSNHIIWICWGFSVDFLDDSVHSKSPANALCPQQVHCKMPPMDLSTSLQHVGLPTANLFDVVQCWQSTACRRHTADKFVVARKPAASPCKYGLNNDRKKRITVRSRCTPCYTVEETNSTTWVLIRNSSFSWNSKLPDITYITSSVWTQMWFSHLSINVSQLQCAKTRPQDISQTYIRSWRLFRLHEIYTIGYTTIAWWQRSSVNQRVETILTRWAIIPTHIWCIDRGKLSEAHIIRGIKKQYMNRLDPTQSDCNEIWANMPTVYFIVY